MCAGGFRHETRSHEIHSVCSHLREREKERQMQPKASPEIMKISEEANEVRNDTNKENVKILRPMLWTSCTEATPCSPNSQRESFGWPGELPVSSVAGHGDEVQSVKQEVDSEQTAGLAAMT